jgi:hypothetical protein
MFGRGSGGVICGVFVCIDNGDKTCYTVGRNLVGVPVSACAGTEIF